MRNVTLLIMAVAFTLTGFGQLTGTKTIPGDYASIAAAIAALNTQGVGAGGVTFNVAAGHTETFATANTGTITATGTAANPVIFQKSGAGANPIITASGGGTLAPSTTLGTNGDGVIIINGGDYITFDGINIQEFTGATGNARSEYGYFLKKASGTDACKNITIKNCTITLDKTNIYSFGIYSSNISGTAEATVTANGGRTENVKFYSNSISNAYGSILIRGFNDPTAPHLFYDQNNEVGVDGGNSFTNLGGGSTTIYSFYAIYQNGLKVANNSFTGALTGTGTKYILYCGTSNYSSVDIYNNTLTNQYDNTTGTVYMLYSGMGHSGTSNMVNIYNNDITGNTFTNATTVSVYFLYHISTCYHLNIYNNNITNNTLGGGPSATATGTFATMYTFGASTLAGSTESIYNNNITGNQRIQSASGGGTTYYMYSSASRLLTNIYNNTISNNTVASTGTAYCIYNTAGPDNKNIYGNTITNILNANGTLYGIYQTTGTNIHIYKNDIRNLNANAASNTLHGIYVSSGTNVFLYNNFIRELKTPASTNNPAINGIYFAGGSTAGAYNNSIYLDGTSSGATFGATGIYASTTPTVELRNNIVVNNITPKGTGRAVAYQRSSTTLTSYANTSNNNDFYAGVPGTYNLIYYDGTNSLQTLAAYQALVSPRDASSISELPPFVNTTTAPYNLHLQTTVPTQCESGGATVSTPVNITQDYDGQSRYPNVGYPDNILSPATAPDIGADEFGGLKLDLTPPNITFTPLGNTSATGARLLTTTITDATGVPTSGAGLPRLYWRINSGAWNSVPGNHSGGSTYTFTFGAGATLNDVVSYYIVAQDLVTPTPNIGANPSGGAAGFTQNPPACSTPPTTPYSYIIVGQLCGNYNVGAGQVYPTLTAAIADINLKELTCPVTLTLMDANYSTSETFPLTINTIAGSSAVNTVTIKPGTGVNATISGNSSTSIFKFNGTANFIIDGSNSGGLTRNLTINNTVASGTTAVVWIGSVAAGSGSDNITVKNCNIANGYNTSTSNGIFIGSAAGIGTAGADNHNITIRNNAISKAYYGIYSNGASTNLYNNLVIRDNVIGSSTSTDYIGYYGIYLAGANAPMISGNEIFNLISGSMTYQTAIELNANLVSPVIWGNHIHDLQNNNTGGWGAYGINVAASSVTGANIINNLIYKVNTINYSTSSTTYNPFGIRLVAGTGHKIYHNTVHMTGTQFASGSTGTLSACLCYTSSAVTGTDVRDNIFANNLEGLTGSTSYCVYAPAGTTFTNINYNDYHAYGTYGVLGFLGTAQATLAAWQGATGQDGNSQSVDPGFVSASDYHPTNMALNNTGFYLNAVPSDIMGDMRTDPPDFGAYNFGNDPVMNTTAATAVTSSTATLNGTANAAGTTMNTYFDYGLTTSYTFSTAAVPSSVSGSTTTPISLGISSLLPNTTYNYRSRGVVSGSGLIVYGPNMTFTTPGPPPTVVTTAATAITTTTATLNGTVNANGSSTTVVFEFGLTTAYGSTITAVQSPVTGNAVTPVNAPITGLTPNTLYHFRVKGTNGGGTSNGNDMTFTTNAIPPVVVTNAASNIGMSTATLNGTVTANSASTTVTFEWGTTTAYGNVAPGVPSPVTGNSPTAVSANISGLTAGITYHFRCVGTNSGGTTNGSDQSFVAGCQMPAAAGPITGPTSVCASASGIGYSVAPIANATSYIWTVPAGAAITAGQGTTSITVLFGTTSGNVTVKGSNSCGDGIPGSLAVTVNPLPTPTVAGPTSACQGTTQTYTTQTGMTGYTWAVSAGGQIISGAGTSSVMIKWNVTGAQWVSVNYTNASGCSAASPTPYNVTVNPSPAPTITGPTSLCVNSGYYDYSTQSGYSNYIWTISAGGTITWGQGTSQIQVSWNTAGPQWVAVNYTNTSGCSASSPTQYNVTVDPLPGAAGAITGTASVCGGATGVAYSTTPITNTTYYVWNLPPGASIASGAGTTSIMVDFAANATSGSITVTGNNICGNGAVSAPFAVTVTPLPAAAGTISGNNAVCEGSGGYVYSVTPIANATGYNWTVPAGATITSGANTSTITVSYATGASSGNISVIGTNSCGNGSASPNFSVTVNPIPSTPTVTVAGYDLTSSAPAGNQWVFEGNDIPGATGQTYTATQSGWYWVYVKLNGCLSDTSNHEYILIVGLDEIPGTSVNIHPVPNNGLFTISIRSARPASCSINIFNQMGSQVYSHPSMEVNGTVTTQIDLRHAASGVYTLVIRNDEGSIIRKIIINR